MSGGLGPLQSGKADGRSKHVSSDMVEVTSHHGVGEAPPSPVSSLESLLPERLELLVVRFDQLE